MNHSRHRDRDRSPRRSRFRPARCPPRSTATADFRTSWWRVCASPGCCAPACRGRSTRWSWRPARRCGAPKRWRAATPRRAGACRSRSPAACWSPTCRVEPRRDCSATGRGVAAGVWAPRGTATVGRRRRRGVRALAVLQRHHPRRHDVRRLLRRRAARAIRRRAAQRRPAGPRHLAHAGPARHRQPRQRCRRGLRARRSRVLGVRRTGRRPAAVSLPGVRVLRVIDRSGRVGQCARRDRRPRRAGRRQEGAGLDAHPGRASGDPGGGGHGRGGAGRRARAVLRGDRRGLAGQPATPTRCRSAMRNRLRLAATHAVRTSADVVRDMYDLAGGSAIYDGAPLQRRFRDAFTATAHFQVNEASRELPGRILLDQPADVSML